MIARKLPSLNALRAFEASARHQSFTLAAQELHVTPGAVSHQVKALEEELCLPLFERLSNQLRLTQAGQRYLAIVGDAFDRIDNGTRSLYASIDRKRLAISTSPNFAAKGLVPRLGAFTAQHPDLAVRLEQSERHVNFIRDDIDVAIRYGAGPWPGLSCTRLGDEVLVPVCAPSFNGIKSIDALAGIPLLHVHDNHAWADWFAAQERQAPSRAGIVFNHESVAIDAAIAGQGAALARSSLVVQALRQGALIAPLPLIMPLAQAYWLIWPQKDDTDGKVEKFSNWLLQSLAADRQFLLGLTSNDG